MSSSQKVTKILIADDEITTAKRLGRYLQDSGFAVRVMHEGALIKKTIEAWRPDFLLIDLTLQNFNAHECLRMLKEKGYLGETGTKVIVLSHHNHKANVEKCLMLGASDYMVKPIKFVDALSRISLQAQAKQRLLDYQSVKNKELRQTHYFLQLTELMLKGAANSQESQKAFYQLVRMLALVTEAVRVSVIRTKLDDTSGCVVASSDDEHVKGFQIDLEKYPEVRYVVRTKRPLFIENVMEDHNVSFISELTKTIKFNSMIVVPIIVHRQVHGVISLRMPQDKHTFSDIEVRFSKICGEIASILARLPNSILELEKHQKAS